MPPSTSIKGRQGSASSHVSRHRVSIVRLDLWWWLVVDGKEPQGMADIFARWMDGQDTERSQRGNVRVELDGAELELGLTEEDLEPRDVSRPGGQPREGDGGVCLWNEEAER